MFEVENAPDVEVVATFHPRISTALIAVEDEIARVVVTIL
jgi:hypothetical protein